MLRSAGYSASNTADSELASPTSASRSSRVISVSDHTSMPTVPDRPGRMVPRALPASAARGEAARTVGTATRYAAFAFVRRWRLDAASLRAGAAMARIRLDRDVLRARSHGDDEAVTSRC